MTIYRHAFPRPDTLFHTLTRPTVLLVHQLKSSTTAVILYGNKGQFKDIDQLTMIQPTVSSLGRPTMTSRLFSPVFTLPREATYEE
jgi:hypothetical protein